MLENHEIFPKPEEPSPVLVHALSRVVTKRQAAAYLAVTTTTIDRWLDAGMPVASRGPGGAITGLDLCAVTRWRLERAGDDSDLEIERTRLTKAQADKAEMEAAVMRAELIRAPIIEAHWQAMVAAMRAALLSMPTSLAPELINRSNLVEVTDIVRDHVYRALEHIASDAFPEEVRRILELKQESET